MRNSTSVVLFLAATLYISCIDAVPLPPRNVQDSIFDLGAQVSNRERVGNGSWKQSSHKTHTNYGATDNTSSNFSMVQKLREEIGLGLDGRTFTQDLKRTYKSSGDMNGEAYSGQNRELISEKSTNFNAITDHVQTVEHDGRLNAPVTAHQKLKMTVKRKSKGKLHTKQNQSLNLKGSMTAAQKAQQEVSLVAYQGSNQEVTNDNTQSVSQVGAITHDKDSYQRISTTGFSNVRNTNAQDITASSHVNGDIANTQEIDQHKSDGDLSRTARNTNTQAVKVNSGHGVVKENKQNVRSIDYGNQVNENDQKVEGTGAVYNTQSIEATQGAHGANLSSNNSQRAHGATGTVDNLQEATVKGARGHVTFKNVQDARPADNSDTKVLNKQKVTSVGHSKGELKVENGQKSETNGAQGNTSNAQELVASGSSAVDTRNEQQILSKGNTKGAITNHQIAVVKDVDTGILVNKQKQEQVGGKHNGVVQNKQVATVTNSKSSTAFNSQSGNIHAKKQENVQNLTYNNVKEMANVNEQIGRTRSESGLNSQTITVRGQSKSMQNVNRQITTTGDSTKSLTNNQFIDLSTTSFAPGARVVNSNIQVVNAKGSLRGPSVFSSQNIAADYQRMGPAAGRVIINTYGQYVNQDPQNLPSSEQLQHELSSSMSKNRLRRSR
jgi:hypothetical protein